MEGNQSGLKAGRRSERQRKGCSRYEGYEMDEYHPKGSHEAFQEASGKLQSGSVDHGTSCCLEEDQTACADSTQSSKQNLHQGAQCSAVLPNQGHPLASNSGLESPEDFTWQCTSPRTRSQRQKPSAWRAMETYETTQIDEVQIDEAFGQALLELPTDVLVKVLAQASMSDLLSISQVMEFP